MTTIDLATLHLAAGQHASPEVGMCLLEATALFSGEPFTDRPACVSPVLTSFGIDLNDRFNDKRRQRLKRFIPLLPGTAGDGGDEVRGYLALDWLIRTHTPAFLDLRPELAKHAAALRNLPEIANLTTAQAAGFTVRAARAAAGDAARAAAGDAAGAAARDAARAVGDAVGAAARYAARAAAGAAARAAAGDAAWAAARDAAWAVGDAVGAAAGDAAWAAAWDAAWDAAEDVLQPTIDRLQDSAIDLFARIINATEERS